MMGFEVISDHDCTWQEVAPLGWHGVLSERGPVTAVWRATFDRSSVKTAVYVIEDFDELNEDWSSPLGRGRVLVIASERALNESPVGEVLHSVRSLDYVLATSDDEAPEQRLALIALEAGAPYVTSTVLRHIAPEQWHGGHVDDRPTLTTRQRQVLRLIAAGGSYANVARSLGIQPCTVKEHLLNVRRTLGVDTSVAAVFEASEAGLL